MTVVQAMIGATANFTWSYAHMVKNDIINNIAVGPFKDGNLVYTVARSTLSKVELNPKLLEEFRGRVEFKVDEMGKSATFLYKNVRKEDDNRRFGVSIDTRTTIHNLFSKLEIVGESCLCFYLLNCI